MTSISGEVDEEGRPVIRAIPVELDFPPLPKFDPELIDDPAGPTTDTATAQQ
jgi:hypothetical protein